jgi:plasmid stabilization system protein ParE
MKIHLTRRALRDLVGIADYIKQQSPEAALRVRGSILKSLETLVLFPRAGRRQNISGVRKLVTRRYSYLVYYTIDDAKEEVRILTIQHPARNREFSDE